MPLCMQVGLGPGDIVLYEDPAPITTKRGRAPPTFLSMSTVSKRSPVSATAELLLKMSNYMISLILIHKH